MTVPLQLQSGLLEYAGQAAVLAGSIVLVLMLVGLGGFAYKSLRGDGITWPDEDETGEDSEVRKGSDDDDWKYY